MSDSSITAFGQAQTAIATGQIDRAMALYLQVTDSLEALEHRQWGELLQQAGYLDLAESLFRRLTQQHAQVPEGWAALGSLLEGRGDLAAARVCFATAHRLRGWPESGDRGYEFSRDWFSNQLPNWVKIIQPLGDRGPIQALEIGSFEGMSACWLLDNVLLDPASHLTCIEPALRPEFQHNLEKTDRAAQVTILPELSFEGLAHLPPQHYDLAYIDGCHAPWVAFRDAVMTWPLLKPDAVMVIDDYQYAGLPEDCPQPGVDLFMLLFSGCFETIYSGYQLFLRKTGEWNPKTAPCARAAGSIADPLLLDGLGWLFLEVQQLELAQEVCDRAIALAPQVAAPYLTLAQIWQQRDPALQHPALRSYPPLAQALIHYFGQESAHFDQDKPYCFEPLVAYYQAMVNNTYWHQPVTHLLEELKRQVKQQGLAAAVAAWRDRIAHPPSDGLALPQNLDTYQFLGNLAIEDSDPIAATVIYAISLALTQA